MAKANAKPEEQGNEEEVVLQDRPYAITEATLKDDFCNYTYEIIQGIGLGDVHKVKGTGIIKDELRHAFGRLNVHLAAVDDVYKHADVEINDINDFHLDDLANLYHCHGIKVAGSDDTMTVILIGSKYVSSSGGRIDLVTPKIPLDNTSSYRFAADLKEEVEQCMLQVALYKDGNYEKPDASEEDGEEKPKRGRKPKQLSINDQMRSEEERGADSEDGEGNGEEENNDDFENARQ